MSIIKELFVAIAKAFAEDEKMPSEFRNLEPKAIITPSEYYSAN
jgi:hypothetical protein